MTLFFRLLLLTFLFSLSQSVLLAQSESERPTGKLSSPKEAAFQHTYYQRADHFNADSSAQALIGLGKDNKPTAVDRALANKLQQIYYGKGLEIRAGLIPDDPNYVDSTSGNMVYVPFPAELPSVYLIKPILNRGTDNEKRAKYWKYSDETIIEIPHIHEEMYPLGSYLLLDFLPKDDDKILGLQKWQYLAILVFILLSFLLHQFFWRIINFALELIANSRLGRHHFDSEAVNRLSRLSSFLIVAYLVFVLTPVLMLPAGLNYYFVGSLRIFNTVFFALLLLSGVDVGRSYFEKIVETTETDSDDQLLPIIIRTIKTLIVIGASMHALSIFGVDVTALIAGLSIGGLAIALAAQETVKNLIGSVMIFADKPFRIGDFIETDGIAGTVEDIGFRSTRVRTLDTTLITVPNGLLVDMAVNNYGEMQHRRFKTTIGVTYYTPPHLIEKFIEGLRRINEIHPKTRDEMGLVHLNEMGGSSLNILFITYFQTKDYAQHIALRGEIILSMLKLAEAMNIHIAFPSTSVYIETMPERKGLVPDYDTTEIQEADKQMEAYLKAFENKYIPPTKP